MDSLVEQILVDILRTEMEMDDQDVWIAQQNFKIPPESGMYISVGMVDAQVLSVIRSSEQYEVSTGVFTLKEITQTVQRENIQIDIFSRDTSALLRRSDVLSALRSVYSVQKQEENNFKIFTQPRNFVNTSSAEGGSNINRFTLTIATHVWYRHEKILPVAGGIYDTFTTRADDEQTIGTANPVFEFTLTE